MNFMCLTSPEVCDHCLIHMFCSNLSVCVGWYKCRVGRPLKTGSSVNSLGIATSESEA